MRIVLFHLGFGARWLDKELLVGAGYRLKQAGAAMDRCFGFLFAAGHLAKVGALAALLGSKKLGRDWTKGNGQNLCSGRFKLAPRAGLEPATSRLTADCSTN